MNGLKKSLLIIFMVVVCIQGCSRAIKSVRPSNKVNGPEELKSALSAMDASLKSLRMNATVRILKSGDRAISVPVNISVRRPGGLRAEILGPFLEIEGLFILNDRTYLFIAMPDRSARAGFANQETLATYLGIPLEPDELEAILCGSIPARDLGSGRLAVEEEGDRYLLSSVRGNITTEYIIATVGPFLEKTVIHDVANKRTITVEYASRDDARPFSVPRRITSVMPGKTESVEIKIHDLEINPSIGDWDFEMNVPEGFKFK